MLPVWLLSKPVMYAAAAAAVVGSVWFYGHTQYQKGYAEMEGKYNQCQQEFRTEADKWNTQIEKQKRELKEFELKKEGTVKRNWDVFKTSAKKAKVNKEKTDAAIVTTIVPTATVRVPMGFVWVYNDAVEGSRVATRASQGAEVPDYSLRPKEETVTFNATYFTRVVKGNVDQYNELAARCSTLIDIVEELEKDYGDYIERPVQPAGDLGGDVLAGTVKDQLF
jgi:hypothetical protein